MMPEEQPIFNNQILDTSLNQPVSNSLDPFQADYTEFSPKQMMHLAGETLIDAWENQGDAKQALVYAAASIFNSNFISNAEIAFGESFNVQKAQGLGYDILTGESGVLPDVEFLSNAEMKGALGAYAESTKTIYINSDFLIDNVDNPGAIGKVLVEEKGHFIDAYANPVDSGGDEGSILAGLVAGENFTKNELQSLKLEDDSTTLIIDGQELRVEQSGNSRTTARRINVGSTTTNFTDSVGRTDTNDYYRFSLNQNSDFKLSLTGLTENADVRLLSSSGRTIASSRKSGNSSEAINRQLNAGNYFIRVLSRTRGNTDYNLGVSATPPAPDLAGNSRARARRINVGSTTTNFTDSVGRTDTNDYYRFTLNQNSNFKLSLTGLTENADVRLLSSSGRTIASSFKSGNSNEAIERQLDAGNYFIRVSPRTRGNTDYNLGVSATPPAPDLAGNSRTTARLITIGSTTTNFTDAVGRADSNDYYRFTLNQNSDFKLSLTGLTENADVRLLSSSGRTIASSFKSRNSSEAIDRQLDAGNYFIRVLSRTGANTNYNLGVSATPLAPPDLARNTLNTARRISVGSTTTNFTDWVGSTDTNDYYRFTLNQNSDFKLSLSGLTENADVRLLNSSGRTIASSRKSGNSSEAISRQLNAGNYFIHVLSRTRGNTDYNLGVSATPPAPDLAGNSRTRARQINLGSTTTNFTDAVGRADSNDYYRFTLNQNSDFKLSLSGLTENADVRLLNSSGRTIASSRKSGNSSEAISRQLNAGNYFIHVLSRTRGNTDYNLGVSATPPAPDLAGNSRTRARQISVGSTTTNFTDAVSRTDTNDYYRFTLNQNSNFKLSLSGLKANADVQLLNANGWIIASSYKSGNSSEAINRQLNAGNYFIRVFPKTITNTNYNLGVSATPLAPPDLARNTLNTARRISVGSTTTNFTDWVGSTDTNDYYRFTLNQNSNFKLSLSGLKANADVQLIQDINRNSKIDANEILGSSNLTGNSAESIIVPLSSGNYFVRIYPGGNGINTTYNLRLSNTSIGNSTYTDSSAIRNSYYNTPVSRAFFKNGISTYQSQHGKFIMHGAIADYYTNNQFANNNTNNGLFGVYSGLGLPTSAIYKKDDGSFAMEFEGGTLTNRNGIVTPSYNQKASSFALVGQGAPNRTELQWKNDYSYWSKDVGTPTSKVRFVAGGWVQEFADSQGKVINILTVKNGRQLTQGGPYRVQGAILDNYRLTGGYERRSGGLGFATRNEQSNFNGYKHYQSFENGFIGITTENKVIIKDRQGQLLNVTGYDGTAIHSTYRNTFNRVGSSLLGSPVSNVRPSGNGFLQEFAGGSDGRGAIMKSNANDKSYWVGGDFWNKLQQAGGASGILSYATSERYTTVSGASRQNFQGGAIIKSRSGIFTVYGGIGSHYLKEGGERGRLGLPTSGEAGIGNGVIVQGFEKGRIVWNGGSARTEIYGQTPSQAPQTGGSSFNYGGRTYQWTRYTIQPNDTLSVIAQRTLGNANGFDLIAQRNNISNPNKINAGQVIEVPQSLNAPNPPVTTPPQAPQTGGSSFNYGGRTYQWTRYTIQPNDTLSVIAQRTLGNANGFDLIAQRNNISNSNKINAGQVIEVPQSLNGYSPFPRPQPTPTPVPTPTPSPTPTPEPINGYSPFPPLQPIPNPAGGTTISSGNLATTFIDNASFTLRNQSLWNRPGFDSGLNWNPTFWNLKENNWLGELSSKADAKFNAYLSTGGFNANLVSDIKISHPKFAKPGEIITLKFASDLENGNLNTRFGMEINGGLNLEFAYKPQWWSNPLASIDVGGLDGSLVKFGVNTNGEGISGNKIKSDGFQDFSFNLLDLPLPQLKPIQAAMKTTGIDFKVGLGPTVNQTTTMMVGGFNFIANGIISYHDSDPNPNDGRTYSYLRIKIPDYLRAGESYTINLTGKPSADISTVLGIGANATASLGYKGFSIGDTFRSPSLILPTHHRSSVFNDYQFLSNLSIKIV